MPHLPDPPAAMVEARRVLKPGRRLAYSVWQEAHRSAMTYVFSAIATHGAPEIALPPGPGASDYADPSRAFPEMTDAGFDELRLVIVDSRWRVDDPSAPFDFFIEGSRTMKGGGAAGVATLSVAGVEVAQQVLAETQTAIVPLVPYLDTLLWVFIAVALEGIGVTIYARLDDWKRVRR